MNIFVLHKDPVVAAQMQCDKHVVKMLLESAQMLCSPFEPGSAPYRRSHYNHPCSRWARESSSNYQWLIKHAFGLSKEYTYRYEKIHKSYSVVKWCEDKYEQLDLPDLGLTDFALAMPDEYKEACPVKSYRNYYIGEKSRIATWKGRKKPGWFK